MRSNLSKVRFLTHTALYLSLAVILPIAFHAFGLGGRIFLPMHIPALLAGFLVGPFSGLIVGLLAPGLSHLLTQMPPAYAVPLMSSELAIYGLIAGITYRRLNLNIYFSLITSLILGRVMFGLSLFFMAMIIELPYSVSEYFAAGAMILSGLPGIAVQIVLIPLVVSAVRRGKGRLED